MRPTLAFLQNMWVRDPQRVLDGIARGGERYRRRAIYQFLFGGCLTGRRLRAAFGDRIGEIEWEESTREIASDSHRICLPQPDHIRAAIATYQPKIVLVFGRVAGDAVSAIWTGPLIQAPHPAARQSYVPDMLKAAAEALSMSLYTLDTERQPCQNPVTQGP